MIIWIKKNFISVFLVVIMLTGFSLIAYPSVANWWNSFHQTNAVANYASAVAEMSHDEYEGMLNAAEEYNKEIGLTGINWNLSDEQKLKYNSLLNVKDSGAMGYIDIPKIRVQLPIYHGTDDTVLQVAVGHIPGSSFPVGGESSHCVLSGHRGLPSAKLLTDIDKLVTGDTWTLNILDQTLTYEVDQIRVVSPSNLNDLEIEQGKDYCTLVTCTPYGINTHRLLVRGHRVPNVQGNARVTADALLINKEYVAPFVAAPILIFLLIIVFAKTNKKKV